jgi:hypothetical protein
MLCRAQEPGLLDLAPIDLADIGPRLITTGSQELLQSENEFHVNRWVVRL